MYEWTSYYGEKLEETVPRYSDCTFRQAFSLTFVCHVAPLKSYYSCLSPQQSLHKKNNNGSKDPVPIAKQLLVFLWYNSNPETLRAIADRFDQVGSCIMSCIRRVTIFSQRCRNCFPAALALSRGAEKSLFMNIFCYCLPNMVFLVFWACEFMFMTLADVDQKQGMILLPNKRLFLNQVNFF